MMLSNHVRVRNMVIILATLFMWKTYATYLKAWLKGLVNKYANSICDHLASYSEIKKIIIIIIIIIIVILGISFMQGIHTYIPQTNHVPREYCVATILL